MRYETRKDFDRLLKTKPVCWPTFWGRIRRQRNHAFWINSSETMLNWFQGFEDEISGTVLRNPRSQVMFVKHQTEGAGGGGGGRKLLSWSVPLIIIIISNTLALDLSLCSNVLRVFLRYLKPWCTRFGKSASLFWASDKIQLSLHFVTELLRCRINNFSRWY